MLSMATKGTTGSNNDNGDPLVTIVIHWQANGDNGTRGTIFAI
jgi:hypothetical protein